MRETFIVPGAPPPAGHYSHAVRAGDVLYVSGQVPRDSTGRYEPADVATETRLTLTNLATIAAAAGARLADAVKITVYLADLVVRARVQPGLRRVLPRRTARPDGGRGRPARGQGRAGRGAPPRTRVTAAVLAALYVGRGRTLSSYALHPDDATLSALSELVLPNAVQSAWPHPRLPVLYVSCGEPPPGSAVGRLGVRGRARPGDRRARAARRPGPDRRPGADTSPPTAPGTTCCWPTPGRRPSRSLRLGPDGAVGEPVEQRPGLDVGVFPHQVRVTPDGRHCLCVSRGLPSPHPWRASRDPQTEPGSLHVIDLDRGRLGASSTLTLGDGSHFGPRNLDTDATGSTYYLGLETQNEVVVLGTDADGRPEPVPRQRFSTLAHPDAEIHQGVGPVLVHPERSVLYVANRAYRPGPSAPHGSSRRPPRTRSSSTRSTARAGCSPSSSASTPAASARAPCRWTRPGGCSSSRTPRPTGWVRATRLAEVPMNLTTFRVLDDGRLEPGHRYPVGDGSGPEIAWSGVAGSS